MPTPLPPTPWEFPHPLNADNYGVVGLGADLEPSTLVGAYRAGLFPMPADKQGLVAWWSPDPRGILELNELRTTRSLTRSCRRFRVTLNQAFRDVITTCSTLPRPGGWISDDMIEAYCELHKLGWAHSIEVWHRRSLVGGLYGVQVDGLFAGESMFHTRTDASKVALVRLVDVLSTAGVVLLDVQWSTDHLASLGVTEVPRTTYLDRLSAALRVQATPLSEIQVEWPATSVLKP